MLVDGIDGAVAVGVFSAVGRAIVVAVRIGRIGAETLLTAVGQLVAIGILGCIDDSVAVGIGLAV
jgi:hypothetical protein